MGRYLTRRQTLALIAALVVAYATFEVGVRLLPPDAVSYETQSSINGGPVMTTSGVITDPATVARWRGAMTAHPDGNALTDYLIPMLERTQTCAPLGSYSVAYQFTWHGIPVEQAQPLGGGCGSASLIWGGGIPDPRLYSIDVLEPPFPTSAP